MKDEFNTPFSQSQQKKGGEVYAQREAPFLFLACRPNLVEVIQHALLFLFHLKYEHPRMEWEVERGEEMVFPPVWCRESKVEHVTPKPSVCRDRFRAVWKSVRRWSSWAGRSEVWYLPGREKRRRKMLLGRCKSERWSEKQTLVNHEVFGADFCEYGSFCVITFQDGIMSTGQMSGVVLIPLWQKRKCLLGPYRMVFEFFNVTCLMHLSKW